MTLGNQDLKRLHRLALAAAMRAGAYIQSMVGRHEVTRTKEAGDTPASQFVTEVDLESQRLILEMLRGSIDEFELGLLTEESADDSSRRETDYFWCIDPLDGTPFIQKKPGYSVSVALVSRDGVPQIGVVHDPAQQTTFHAIRGQGAMKDGTPIRVEPNPASGSLTWIMDQSMRNAGGFPVLSKCVERLEASHSGPERVDFAGAALNACWVTQLAPAVYFKMPKRAKGGGSLWDFAASACIVCEWGLEPTDIAGQQLHLNRAESTFMNERGVIYASDLRLREAVQRIHRGIVDKKTI